ncbi:uncharacterized protein BP5553_03716 [Venustampulla echinocandica]|uniref:Uncharacterized protein n=1 Tax=Venustampulla echinocandica TaxID=2656787 RepID=A0A370TV26_9HELO|nr:uncharacterized protein BP5553_03716 [Venustampulla echinocandica]RDL39376.1 hypothetical protein BP5553_03716 [Venustampulla echinocandica]
MADDTQTCFPPVTVTVSLESLRLARLLRTQNTGVSVLRTLRQASREGESLIDAHPGCHQGGGPISNGSWRDTPWTVDSGGPGALGAHCRALELGGAASAPDGWEIEGDREGTVARDRESRERQNDDYQEIAKREDVLRICRGFK